MSRDYFGSWGHALVAVSVVERFKQEPMYGLSAGTKKVAVVERWPLVRVRLSLFLNLLSTRGLQPLLKAAMLGVNTKTFFSKNLHENTV